MEVNSTSLLVFTYKITLNFNYCLVYEYSLRIRGGKGAWKYVLYPTISIKTNEKYIYIVFFFKNTKRNKIYITDQTLGFNA